MINTIERQKDAFKEFDEIILNNPDILPQELRIFDPINKIRAELCEMQKKWERKNGTVVDFSYLCSQEKCYQFHRTFPSLLNGIFCEKSGKYHICGYEKCKDILETHEGFCVCYYSLRDLGPVMYDECEFNENGQPVQHWSVKPKKDKDALKEIKIKKIKENKRKSIRTPQKINDSINNIFIQLLLNSEAIEQFNKNIYKAIIQKSKTEINQHIKNSKIFFFSDIICLVHKISALYEKIVPIDVKDPRIAIYKSLIVSIKDLCDESPYSKSQNSTIDQNKFILGLLYIIDRPSTFNGIDDDVCKSILNEKLILKALPKMNNLEICLFKKKISCNYITMGINYIQTCLSSYEHGYSESEHFFQIKKKYEEIHKIILTKNDV